MKSFKAVSFREPWPSRIASGEETHAFKGMKTSYRGPIVVVSADEPTYARAIANLIDVRPMAGEEDAPIRRGFVWDFANVKAIPLYAVKPRGGLFTVELPEGALPPDEQTKDEALAAKSPTERERDDESVKATIAANVQTARSSLCRAAGGVRALVSASSEAAALEGVQGSLDRLRTGIDQLIDGMIKANPLWSERLSPWVNGAEWPSSPDSSSLTPEHRRAKRLDVLVVDDEPVLLRGLARVLSGRHDVRTASSKSEARARIRERTPDVLVCDYQIEWQSSEDLLAEVRDSHPMVRRVLYSFSRIEVWCKLLERKLIDAAVPKSAPTTQLLDAIG
jgi:CheY-like chemotaxis protein